MNFAMRLKKILSDKKVSQSELSRMTKINRAIISEYIHGKYEPKADKLIKIAQALNVAPSELSDDYIAVPPQQSTDTSLPPPQATLKPETLETAQKLEALNSDTKRMIKDMIDREYERSSAFVLEEEGIA